MRPAVRDELLRLNRAFYQNLAEAFAATRARAQPGVVRALAAIDHQASVLDVGCGHGLAAAQLAQNGHSGPYLGIDASGRLVDLARQTVDASWARFLEADLAEPGWTDECRTFQSASEGPADRGPAAFEWALVFAVLHHLPGDALRLRLLSDLRTMLSDTGRAAVSVWEFPDDDRMRQRIVPWETIGLAESAVDPGDFLLDWRHEARGLRYVHRFDSSGLAALAEGGGFDVVDEYRSDGEGGRMGLYQIWG